MITVNTPCANPSFWKDKSVLVTGHTGFKGGWLSLWLKHMGALVHGYSLPPRTNNNLFELTQGKSIYSSSELHDVRDRNRLLDVFQKRQPDIVFHLAAQALVQQSYADPVEAFETNIMGTVNLLESVRQTPGVRSVVIVTSDKCYENREWPWGYRENEALGGQDPYSASKACAELISRSWQVSFLEKTASNEPSCALATARAGNVIGGGDWSENRLVPDILASVDAGQPVLLRNPDAVRPWQHVLEPLSGYLLLAEKLYHDGQRWSEPWNFGPYDSDNVTVAELVTLLMQQIGCDEPWQRDPHQHSAEAQQLRLDCSKARQQLGWLPVWTLRRALREIAAWHNAWRAGHDMHRASLDTIKRYVNDASSAGSGA